MMVKLNEFNKQVLDAYETYSYQDVYKLTNNFVSFSLSNFYLDFTKDILYIEKADSKVRRSVQTVLHNVLYSLIRLLAPILPYTSEEVYGYMNMDEKSVHMERMPEVVEYENAENILKEWDLFFDVKAEVNKALEDARNEKLIGSSLEAEVELNVKDEYKDIMNKLKDNLKQLFIVSNVTMTENEVPENSCAYVKVVKSTGEKCERCWNYVEHTENVLCERCANVLK